MPGNLVAGTTTCVSFCNLKKQTQHCFIAYQHLLHVKGLPARAVQDVSHWQFGLLLQVSQPFIPCRAGQLLEGVLRHARHYCLGHLCISRQSILKNGKQGYRERECYRKCALGSSQQGEVDIQVAGLPVASMVKARGDL
jgi:hypothetical protein